MHSVKAECLNQFILFGEGSLRRALRNFCAHIITPRGTTKARENRLLFHPGGPVDCARGGNVCCRERLGGLLKYYHREAA